MRFEIGDKLRLRTTDGEYWEEKIISIVNDKVTVVFLKNENGRAKTLDMSWYGQFKGTIELLNSHRKSKLGKILYGTNN